MFLVGALIVLGRKCHDSPSAKVVLPFATKTLPTRKQIIFELFSDYRFTISISSN